MTGMAITIDKGRNPTGGDEVLASATTLVGSARAPGRPRLALGVRLACAPFLFRGRPAGQGTSASGSAEATPLQWALLPLASLLPWLSLLTAEAAQAATTTPAAPSPAARLTAASADLVGDDVTAGARRRSRAPGEEPVALTPLPVRSGPAQRPGATAPAVLPLRTPAARASARAPTSEASERDPVWRAPEVARTAESDDSQPGPALASPTPRHPSPAPEFQEFTWNPPLITKRQFAAPPIAAAAEPPPTLSAPRPAPGLDLEFTAQSAQPERMPTLHPRVSTPNISQLVEQVVRQLRSEVTQTVVTEVQKAAVKLAQANPPPRPSEVLAELYTDQSIRKLLARMRRVELEERRRGGLL